MKITNILALTAACLLTVPAVVSTTGCASGTQYDRSTGEWIDDKATNRRVSSALGDDPVYKFENVEVKTMKGTVQLSGFVVTEEQKEQATEIARRIDGVQDVINNITVRQALP